MTLYVQCFLQHQDNRIDTRWIPKHLAEKGKTLRVKTESNEWDYGWEVKEVYQGIRTEAQVIFERDKHRDHRKATDI